MTVQPSCCEKCWGWPADKTPEEGSCTHQFCKCHKTSSLQDLMEEREVAFAIEFKQACDDLGFPHAQAVRSRLETFLRDSIRLAFLAGMEEAKGCLPEMMTGFNLDDDTVNYKWMGRNECRAATLAAIEKKSREVGEITK